MSDEGGAPPPAGSAHRTYLAYRGGAAVLGLLPRPVAIALGAGIGRLAGAARPEQRAVVAQNLAHVRPGLDARELDRLVRRSFASYGAYWADVAKLTPRAKRRLDRRYRVTGREHIDAALRAGRGVIFALPHLGAWEAGGMWAAVEGFPILTVAEPAVSPELSAWFERRRSGLGIEVLPPTPDASVALLNRLRHGGAVALVADRDVVGDGDARLFFGAPAKVPLGPAVLALRSGAALIPSAVYQRGAAYEAVFAAPLDTARRGRLREDVERVVDALLREFERLIAAAPEQWHVFQPQWASLPAAPSS